MSSEPPSPDGLPFLGNTVEYARDRFEFIDAAKRECGDVFRAELLGLGEICYLTHPDSVERVLVTDRESFAKSDLFRVAFGEGLLAVDGEQWERQRELLDEFFYPARIRSYADEMVDLTERRIDRFSPGETRSLLEEMTALTLDIIFGTMFGRRLEIDGNDELRRAVANLNEWFTPTSLVMPRGVPTPSRRRFRRAEETLRSEVRSLLSDASDAEGDDLLSTLVGLDSEEMSEENIVDQVVTMLFAGHESTALGLTYAFYELGRNPDIRDRFHEELDATLDGARPTLDDVGELEVTDRIVTEALRMYPPAPAIPRVTTADVELGGYRVPAGTRTHVSLFTIQRDERFYDDPLTFDPSRWREQGPEAKGYAYAPFGAGPRTCIGRRFALLEATLVLAAIGRRYRLDPEEPLELAPRMSTQPAGEVPITVRERA